MICISKIKTKELVKGTIKTIDKIAVATEKTKETLVNVKEKSENAYNSDNSVNNYSSNKLSNNISTATNKVIDKGNKIGKRSVKEIKTNIIKTKDKIKYVKNKLIEKKNIKVANNTIKTSNKVVNEVNQKMVKDGIKKSQKATKIAKESAKKTYEGIKVVVKATISSIKAIIAGTKALVSALIAGGWVALMIVIVICLIGLLCSSIYGIFFSSEDIGNTITMSNVVSDINKEMNSKIEDIKNNNTYDNYKIESDRAEWKEILAVYSVKISNGNNEVEVITLDDDKINIIKDIFWNYHSLDSEIKTETYLDETTDEEKEGNVLYIKIKSKSLEEVMNDYNFSDKQKKQVKELLSENYSNLWSSAIFGTPLGSPSIVQIALSQLGNVGGEPFWSWYGFSSRVEWCAVFVSWVANQAGYIESGIIPKFSGCQNGIDWFKAMGQWQEKGYVPKTGDIIFFDWEVDGMVNHVGIVEKVENGKVYTIEGNSNDDTCRQKEYSLNSRVIFGYGTPQY